MIQGPKIEEGNITGEKERAIRSKRRICSGYGKLISSAIVTTTGGRSPFGGGEIFLRNGVGWLCFGDNRQGYLVHILIPC
jgi:hypothetical protein